MNVQIETISRNRLWEGDQSDSFLFHQLSVLELVGEPWHDHHRHSVVHGLHGAVDAPVGDEQLAVGMPWGKERDEREEDNFIKKNRMLWYLFTGQTQFTNNNYTILWLCLFVLIDLEQ